MYKRMISFLLAILLIVTLTMPVSVFADEYFEEMIIDEYNENTWQEDYSDDFIVEEYNDDIWEPEYSDDFFVEEYYEDT